MKKLLLTLPILLSLNAQAQTTQAVDLVLICDISAFKKNENGTESKVEDKKSPVVVYANGKSEFLAHGGTKLFTFYAATNDSGNRMAGTVNRITNKSTDNEWEVIVEYTNNSKKYQNSFYLSRTTGVLNFYTTLAGDTQMLQGVMGKCEKQPTLPKKF